MVYTDAMKLAQKKFNSSLKGIKKKKKHHWLYQGMSFNNDEDFDYWYNRYLNSYNCEKCNHDYSYSKKCLHHDHSTAEVIAVVCQDCNAKDREDNTSGIANISFVKPTSRWCFKRQYRGKQYSKHFDTKLEALHFKIAHNMVIKLF